LHPGSLRTIGAVAVVALILAPATLAPPAEPAAE
jgi:hypothetical protein